MRNQRLILALLGLLALLLYTAGCDSSDNPIAPNGSVLTITANPTQISLNGTSTISVVGFKPDGNPLNPGTQIRLTTDLGVLSQTLITVTDGGRASTTLRGDGRTGAATVTASVVGGGGGDGGGGGPTVTVQIGEDPTSQESLSITATPSRINIEQESRISVIARNADGSRAAGTQVTLRTDLGTLDNELLTTDANGEASTIFRPDGRSSSDGGATITGSVASSVEEVTATVNILGTVVDISASPSTLDTLEASTLTVLVRDVDNIPLRNGYSVRLTSTLGTLDPSTVETNSSGEGTSTYTAGDRAGSDTISAFLENSDTSTATITIRDAPATVTLDVDIVEFTPDTDGTDFTLTVRVANAEGEPLVNEIVRFEVLPDELGATFVPAGGPTTGGGGTATATMTITSSGIPAGLASFTVQALVRDVGSNIVTIRILGGDGGGGG